MATLSLVRGVWQKEFTSSAAASGTNTYVLAATDTGILIKVEGVTNTGSIKMRVRWLDASTPPIIFVEDFTSNLDALADGTGITQGGYTHATMLEVPRRPSKKVQIDIRILTTLTAASVWITAY
jgi:hypothetical protein